MVTMAQAREQLERDPTWMVEMVLPRCTLENGIFPCMAFNDLYSLNFDGVNEYVDTNYSVDMSGSGAASLFLWYKGTAGGSQYIASQAHTLAGYSSDFILGYLNGGLWFRSQTISGSNIIFDGNWHMTGFTWDGTTARLFIDGVEIGTGITPLGFGAVSDLHLMTRGDASTSFVAGALNDVSVWDVKLSSDEVLELYNAGCPMNLTLHSKFLNLDAWYKMGDGDDFTGAAPFTVHDFTGVYDGVTGNMEAVDKVLDSPCPLSINPCKYTFFTCKNQTNFDKGFRSYYFWSRGANIQSNIQGLPYLDENFTRIPTAIDERRFQTIRGEVRFTFADDSPMFEVDPTKTTTQTEDQELAGRYWARLLARNPNTKGNIINLYRGYDNVDPADFELFFKGKIENINWEQGGVEIRAVDLLYELYDKKIPGTLSDNANSLITGMNAVVTSIVVGTAAGALDEFPEKGTVKIGDELIPYTGKNVGLVSLTGGTRGGYGSTAATHTAGDEIKLVHAFCEKDQTTFNEVPVYLLIYEVLIELAEIPLDNIDWFIPNSNKLTAGIAANALLIPVTNIDDFYERGVIRINEEVIYFNGKVPGNLVVPTLADRGKFGTTAAAHLINDDIYLSEISFENERWRNGMVHGAIIEKETSLNDILSEFQEVSYSNIWQNQAGEITGKVQAPPLFTTTPRTIDLVRIENGSRKVDRDEESRITRSYIYYSPNENDPGKDQSKYANAQVDVGAVAESPNAYDDIKIKQVYARFINNEYAAQWLATHIFVKYENTNPIVEFRLDLIDEEINVADLIYLVIPEIVDEDGAPITTKLYRIIYKKYNADNSITFKAKDSSISDSKYKLIGPENRLLDQNMTNIQITMDVDIGFDSYVAHADFNTIGTLKIMSGAGNELIKYTGLSDLGAGITRFTGLTRDFDGALGGGVAHTAGDEVLIMFSAAGDRLRAVYGWFGDPVNNELDGNADGVLDTDGYLLW